MDARALDQFYTRPEVAARCVAWTTAYLEKRSGCWIWIEPSAGDGAFLDALPYPHLALDIEPRAQGISRADFLSWVPGSLVGKPLFIGNPPFGKNASLARRFFDKAAEFGEVIAFILPRTFQKPAFVSRLNERMHLVFEQILDESSFVFRNEPYAVPTVFQIWEKRRVARPKDVRKLKHEHFSFVCPANADFAFQRVGARAGLVSFEGLRKSQQSHYFLKSHIATDHLFQRLASLDWNSVKWCTAGNPSIGKSELVATYESVHG